MNLSLAVFFFVTCYAIPVVHNISLNLNSTLLILCEFMITLKYYINPLSTVWTYHGPTKPPAPSWPDTVAQLLKTSFHYCLSSIARIIYTEIAAVRSSKTCISHTVFITTYMDNYIESNHSLPSIKSLGIP